LPDFHNSVTDVLSWKFAIKLLIKIPPHLKCVATLPREMLMFANRATFCQSLIVSVGVSKLGCTHLIFVDPAVKINGCYYREVLLRQQLLPAIRQVSGDFFVLHQDSARAQRAREIMHFGRSRSSKVIDFGTNRKRVCVVCDLLLVRRSNLGPVLHRFGDIAGFCAHGPTPIPP